MRKRVMIVLFAVCAAIAVQARDFRWLPSKCWDVSVSFSMKWYTYSSGGKRHYCNFFGEDANMEGLRYGVGFRPFSWRGWGIKTGVYGEIYSCKDETETMRIELFGMYFPLHAMYELPAGKSVTFDFATGPSLCVGLIQHVIDPTNSSVKGYNMAFNDGSPHRVDCLWEASAGATIKMFRFSLVYSISLTPNKKFLSPMGTKENYLSTGWMGLSINAGIAF